MALVALNEITTEPPSDALVMLADGSLRHAEQMPTSEAARAEFAGRRGCGYCRTAQHWRLIWSPWPKACAPQGLRSW
ncbi:hypothetical protein [Roseinatronobacter monicus]|uniref:hypothetical protein n=1 Tax=Roseinatronobacter monicus TaxID=393481 RepID=UPI003F2C53CD